MLRSTSPFRAFAAFYVLFVTEPKIARMEAMRLRVFCISCSNANRAALPQHYAQPGPDRQDWAIRTDARWQGAHDLLGARLGTRASRRAAGMHRCALEMHPRRLRSTSAQHNRFQDSCIKARRRRQDERVPYCIVERQPLRQIKRAADRVQNAAEHTQRRLRWF